MEGNLKKKMQSVTEDGCIFSKWNMYLTLNCIEILHLYIVKINCLKK